MQRPVERRPPTSTASSTRSGVRAKNDVWGSVVTIVECILSAALTMPRRGDSMRRMGIYDQIKAFFQDIVASEIRALRADLQRVDEKIDGLDARLMGKIDAVDGRLASAIDTMDVRLTSLDARFTDKLETLDARVTDKVDGLIAQMGHMKGELIAEIRRVDVRIDSMDRELRVAIDIRERLAALEARRA